MPAPKELVDDLCAAIERHNVMVSRSSAWANSVCPFKKGDIRLVAGRTGIVSDVYCRLLNDSDGGYYMVWEVSLLGMDGFEFTLSERAMPTKGNPQN